MSCEALVMSGKKAGSISARVSRRMSDFTFGVGQ